MLRFVGRGLKFVGRGFDLIGRILFRLLVLLALGLGYMLLSSPTPTLPPKRPARLPNCARRRRARRPGSTR